MNPTEYPSPIHIQPYRMPIGLKAVLIISLALTIIAASSSLYFGLTSGINTLVFYSSSIGTFSFLTTSLLVLLKVANRHTIQKSAKKQPSLNIDRKNNTATKDAQTKTLHSESSKKTTTHLLSYDSLSREFNIKKLDVQTSYHLRIAFDNGNYIILNKETYDLLHNKFNFFCKFIPNKHQNTLCIHNVDEKLFIKVLADHLLSNNIFEEPLLDKIQLSAILHLDICNKYFDALRTNSTNIDEIKLLRIVHHTPSLHLQAELVFNELLKSTALNFVEFKRIIELLVSNGFTFNRIELSNLHLNEEHLKEIAKLPCMELDLSHSKGFDSLESLKGMSKIENLNISYSEISDLASLNNFFSLKILNLEGCQKIISQQFKIFLNCSKLKKLNVKNTQFSSLRFLYLSPITELNLEGCTEIIKEDFISLTHLTNLTSINLSKTNITNLFYLLSLKNLHELILNNCFQLYPSSYPMLESFTSLTILSIENIRSKTNILSFLKPLKKLESLNLAYCELNTDDYEYLKDCQSLKTLNLKGSNIPSTFTETVLKKLKLNNVCN